MVLLKMRKKVLPKVRGFLELQNRLASKVHLLLRRGCRFESLLCLRTSFKKYGRDLEGSKVLSTVSMVLLIRATLKNTVFLLFIQDSDMV